MMFVLKVGDRGYIGRKGGPNGYTLVERSQDALRFKKEDYAQRCGRSYMDRLEQDGIYATAIAVSCRGEKP